MADTIAPYCPKPPCALPPSDDQLYNYCRSKQFLLAYDLLFLVNEEIAKRLIRWRTSGPDVLSECLSNDARLPLIDLIVERFGGPNSVPKSNVFAPMRNVFALPNPNHPNSTMRPLHVASERCVDISVVSRAIQLYPEALNMVDKRGHRPQETATANRNEAVFNLVRDCTAAFASNDMQGVERLTMEALGETPPAAPPDKLITLIVRGDFDAAQHFVESLTDAQAVDQVFHAGKDGWHPLLRAVHSSSTAPFPLVELIIRRARADPQQRSIANTGNFNENSSRSKLHSNRPLHFSAATCTDIRTTALLIKEAPWALLLRDRENRLPEHHAELNHKSVLALVRDCAKAVERGDKPRLEQLVDDVLSPAPAPVNDSSPPFKLTEMIRSGKLEEAHKFLSNLPDEQAVRQIFHRGGDGKFGLEIALRMGTLRPFVELILRRADADPLGRNILSMQNPTYPPGSGHRPLHRAARNCDTETVARVVELFPDALLLRDCNGKRPVDISFDSATTTQLLRFCTSALENGDRKAIATRLSEIIPPWHEETAAPHKQASPNQQPTPHQKASPYTTTTSDPNDSSIAQLVSSGSEVLLELQRRCTEKDEVIADLHKVISDLHLELGELRGRGSEECKRARLY